MAEQLKLLLKSEEMTFTSGMPLVLCGYSLLADRKNGRLYAQLDFLSMSDARISKVMTDVVCRDKNGGRLQGVVGVAFNELFRNRGQKFGEGKLIKMPDNRTRSLEVYTKRAEFDDGSYCDARVDAVNKTVPVQQRLVDYFDSDRYAEQYKRQTNLGAEFVAADMGEKWVCSCGAFNSSNENKCYKCTLNLERLKSLLDKEKLVPGLRAYDEECKENRKRQLEEKAAQAKKSKRTRTLIKLLAAAVVIAAVFVTVWVTVVVPGKKYKKAEEMYYDMQYQQAAEELFKLGGYKDSARFYRYLNEQRLLLRYGLISEYGEDFEFDDIRLLRKEGRLYNIKMIEAGQGTVGLKTDGTAFAYAINVDVENWENIVEVSGSFMHAAGLRGDGTVVVAGLDHKVVNWENIMSVRTGAYHTVGLKADKSVVAAGENNFGQCDVESWSGIASIYTGGYTTVGLRTDGTVIAAGQNKYGELDLGSWQDIEDIVIYGYTVIGLKTDGSVVAAGENDKGQCDVENWSDIVSVAAGDGFTIGLKKDGSVVSAGTNEHGQCDLSTLDSVVFIDAGEFHTIAVLSDGRVVAVGKKDRGECAADGMDLW